MYQGMLTPHKPLFLLNFMSNVFKIIGDHYERI